MGRVGFEISVFPMGPLVLVIRRHTFENKPSTLEYTEINEGIFVFNTGRVTTMKAVMSSFRLPDTNTHPT